MKEQLKSFNPKIKFFWGDYPSKTIIPQKNGGKKYDIVFFARISKDKGIGDLLQALSILKKNKENITLCVIGSGQMDTWKKLAEELGVAENITWIGFLPTQHEVHKIASQSKISVLPTYHDIVSGTIIESLFLKLPVVAYNVGSIHEINKKDEIVSLVEKWNINELAKAIEFLLNNPEILEIRAEKGYIRVKEMFNHSVEKIKESLIKAYKKVIIDFKNT
jgi:glycosyltransferase involved in cell wall biosynthesis